MEDWSGCFSSTMYSPGFVNGTFHVSLNNSKKKYKAPFSCEYRGLYRNGTVYGWK